MPDYLVRLSDTELDVPTTARWRRAWWEPFGDKWRVYPTVEDAAWDKAPHALRMVATRMRPKHRGLAVDGRGT